MKLKTLSKILPDPTGLRDVIRQAFIEGYMRYNGRYDYDNPDAQPDWLLVSFVTRAIGDAIVEWIGFDKRKTDGTTS